MDFENYFKGTYAPELGADVNEFIAKIPFDRESTEDLIYIIENIYVREIFDELLYKRLLFLSDEEVIHIKELAKGNLYVEPQMLSLEGIL